MLWVSASYNVVGRTPQGSAGSDEADPIPDSPVAVQESELGGGVARRHRRQQRGCVYGRSGCRRRLGGAWLRRRLGRPHRDGQVAAAEQQRGNHAGGQRFGANQLNFPCLPLQFAATGPGVLTALQRASGWRSPHPAGLPQAQLSRASSGASVARLRDLGETRVGGLRIGRAGPGAPVSCASAEWYWAREQRDYRGKGLLRVSPNPALSPPYKLSTTRQYQVGAPALAHIVRAPS